MRVRLGLVEAPLVEPPAAISQKATVDPEAAAWRRERLALRNALILALRRIAPALFAGRERDHPPLAIGIDKEIQAALPDVNRNILGAVLRTHTAGQGYLTHLAAGEDRRHLDGSSAGPPVPGDVTGAASRLETMQKKRKVAAGDVLEEAGLSAQVKVPKPVRPAEMEATR
jgi:sRNA-binding protein